MQDQLNQRTARPSGRWRGRKSLLITVLGFYLFLAAVGSVLSMPDLRCKADALVLLSGGDKAREEEIARLYKKGCSEKVVLTRTSGATRGNHIYTLQDLAKIGIPDRAVLFTPGQSDSTYDEARHVLELMDNKNMGDVIVVTDPYHVFRARMIFKGEFRASRKSVWIRPAHEHWYNPLTWMFRIEGWEVTLKELGKIGAYLIGIKGS